MTREGTHFNVRGTGGAFVGAGDSARPISVIASQSADWRGNPLLLLRYRVTDSHTSDVGHWFGMTWWGRPLPLPLGEVAVRSEDGEGRNVKKICRWHIFSVDLSGYAAVASIWVFTVPVRQQALSVTCGDSSPRGRAKGGVNAKNSPLPNVSFYGIINLFKGNSYSRAGTGRGVSTASPMTPLWVLCRVVRRGAHFILSEKRDRSMTQVLKGHIVHAPALGRMDITENGFLVLEDGVIAGVYHTLPDCYAYAPLRDFGDKLIMQSFADMHLHAPQYPMLGMGMDLPLLDWLNTYTFPTESRFADLDYARRTYRRLASDLITNGTTRVSMFSSLHTEATWVLMEELEKAGVTGYVGKVNMDRNGLPGVLQRPPRSPSARRCAGWRAVISSMSSPSSPPDSPPAAPTG